MWRTLLLALLLCLTVGCAALKDGPQAVKDESVIPFATLDDLPQGGSTSVRLCPNGEPVSIQSFDDRYGLLMVPPKFILIDFQLEQAWLGTLKGRTLKVEKRFSLEEVKAKYPSPCMYLVPGVQT